jgi:hypothetical protein
MRLQSSSSSLLIFLSLLIRANWTCQCTFSSLRDRKHVDKAGCDKQTDRHTDRDGEIAVENRGRIDFERLHVARKSTEMGPRFVKLSPILVLRVPFFPQLVVFFFLQRSKINA